MFGPGAIAGAETYILSVRTNEMHVKPVVLY